jgi:CAAX protease family protein
VQGVCQELAEQRPQAMAGGPLAPWWHTRLLVSVLLLAPAVGLLLGRDPAAEIPGNAQVAGVYLPLLLVSAGFAIYVSRLGLGRSVLPELLGLRVRSPRQALVDIAWALLLGAAILSVDGALQRLGSWPESVAAHALLPRSFAAKSCWLVVAGLVALTEELVYRGYLQRQLAALTGCRVLGVVVQAALFGIAHGEQGAFAVARFSVYGLAFGWVASKRQGLLAVMLCHFGLDVYAGFSG